MFADWSRAEILQLTSIIVSGVVVIIVPVVGRFLNKKIQEVHILINSRMTELIAGAQAQGQVKERAEADARHISGNP